MLNMNLEFELEYDCAKRKLLLIDYDPPNDKEDPVRLAFTNVNDIDGIKTVVGAWITLKAETEEKKACNA